MSWIDQLKMLYQVLWKGRELADVEFWKNVQATKAVLAGVLAGLLGIFHRELPPEVVEYISYAISGLVAAVLYFIPATSKRMGLPAGGDASTPT